MLNCSNKLEKREMNLNNFKVQELITDALFSKKKMLLLSVLLILPDKSNFGIFSRSKSK